MKVSNKEARVSWVDNLVGLFSPRAKLHRVQCKLATNIIRRKYEGACVGRRTSGWGTASTSANAEIGNSLSKLRDRSRDLVRNNTYAKRGIQVVASNVVGRGIGTQFKTDPARKEKQINDIWKTWAGTSICDYDGINNIFGLQRLVTRAMVEGGECIVRLRRVENQITIGPDGVERQVPPIQIQLLEGDFLNSAQTIKSNPNGNKIIQGIELDPRGKRIAYHLFKEHPGNNDINIKNIFQTVRVDKSDIAHIFEIDRAGQLRGIPWLSSAIIRLRDFDEYEDAQLVRQKIAAMFTAFVHDLSGIDADITTQEKEDELGEKMEPGIIELLPSGKDIKLSNPPGVENYKEYTSTVLHAIASGLGITYESLTSDYTDVNFSSARMSKTEMNLNVDDWQWQIIIPRFMQVVVQWFLQSSQLLGVKTDGVKTIYTPPRRMLVDPTKEIPALKTAVRSGFMTLSEAVRQGGSDPETHYNEYEQDNKILDEKKLTVDTDARKVANTGALQKTDGATPAE
jgi:lambda family phage portal protein